MKRLLRVGTVLLALSTVILPRLWLFAAEDEAVPTDRLLPPDVSVYVSIPDVDALKARFAKSSYGGIAEDPAFEPFKAEIFKAVDNVSSEVEKHLGVTLKDLLEIPSGEFAAAVLTPPGKKFAAVMFLDFGENKKTVNALLDKGEKALEEQGATSDDEEYENTKITIWTIKKDADGEDTPNKFVYFLKDTMIVIASDLNTAKSVLDRWDGKHSDTFADNNHYNLILEKCQTDDEDGLLVWFINPMGLVQAAVSHAAATNPQLGLMTGFLEPLGANSMKAIGGSFDMATEEFDGVSKTFIAIEPPTKGILNIFQFPAAEQKPPRWVSANASAWFSLNWDIATAYQAVGTMVDMFRFTPGAFAAMIDQFAEREDGPRIHLKKDVIDLIAGRIQVAMEPGQKKSDEETQGRIVVALGLKDAKRFQATLAKIAKIPGFPGKTREFKGSTIYEFEVPNFAGGGEPMMAGMAVGQDQLLISNDVTALEASLRGDTDGDSLADSPNYKRIAEYLPAKTSIVSFQQQDSQIEALWQTARSGKLSGEIADIDFTKLPDFDAIKKYMQPSGSYAVPDKKGVLFVSFSTKPKK